MTQRKLLDVTDTIEICRSHVKITADLLRKAIDKTKEGDCILGINKEEFEYSRFGSMEDMPGTYQSHCLIIYRQVPETDEQYFARCQKEEAHQKEVEERERLQYLKLKAKFEPEQQKKRMKHRPEPIWPGLLLLAIVILGMWLVVWAAGHK